MDGNTGIARTRYDEDFIAWARQQAAALRARDADAIDWDFLAEEMDSLGASDLAQLESRLIRLMAHLLKLDHGKNRDPARQWELTVREQRRAIKRLLKRMPSLEAKLPEMIVELYPDARAEALDSFELYEPERLGEYARVISQECVYSAAALINGK